MAFLKELTGKPPTLKPTTTVVRTLGFVEDTSPDYQVAVFRGEEFGDGRKGGVVLGSQG